jgi:hypothetical protein
MMSHGMSRLQVERLREWGKEVDVQYTNRINGRTSKADELYELARLWANGGTGEIRTNAHALFLVELEEAFSEKCTVRKQFGVQE